MRYPKFLPKKGTIGFVAPSFGVTTEPYQTRFNSALETLKKQGYKTIIGPNCFKEDGLGKSSSPQNCGEELNRFFIDEPCDVLLSVGGGETMCEDLPYVDFKTIAQATPKWFMGYSDNTNLTFTLPTLCDTAALYGPCATAFGYQEPHPSLGDALALLKGEKLIFNNYPAWDLCQDEVINPLECYSCTQNYQQKLFHGNKTTDKIHLEGRLIGGCLDVLNLLCGTRFDQVESFCAKYAQDGIVWFLEACEYNPLDVQRSLWKLKESHWFTHTKGFLFGRPMMYQQTYLGINHTEGVLNSLGDLNVPILMNLDFGHLPPMMPIISGAYAKITAVQNDFTIEYVLK